MKFPIVASLLFAIAAFQAHPETPVSAIDPKAYPPEKFAVTQAAYPFGNLTVKVTQIKKKNPDGEQPRFCRAWLEAFKGDNLFKRVDYNDIDPQDGPYGIFLPPQQPSSRYVIALKEGGGDPRVLLMTHEGDFLDIPGGFYFVTADRHYLVTQTTADGGAVSVFDLVRGELLVDAQQVPSIFAWRAGGPGDGYFFTEAGPSEDGVHPVEQQDHGYVLSFRRGLRRIPMAPEEIKRGPKVKLEFDPRKFPNCGSAP